MTVTEVPVGPEVGFKVIDGEEVTVKVALAVAEPLFALTEAGPEVDAEGTVNAAEKVPVEVVVTVAGLVVTSVPLNAIVTVAVAG